MLPESPSDLLPEFLLDLRLSASTIAGAAQLLLLEMQADVWVRKVSNRIGLRCGHPSEYGFASQLSPAYSLPEMDAISAADLERRLWEKWHPRFSRENEYGNIVDVATLDTGALSDAVCTVLSLLVLAKEIVVDEEANTFQRVYPVGRAVLLEEAVDAIRRSLSARYGPAVALVRALGCRHNLGRIRVEHDGTLPDEEVTQLRGFLQQYVGAPDINPLNSGWLAALFPDGSATRLRQFHVNRPAQRLRREDVPENGELVWFRIRQVSLGRQVATTDIPIIPL